MSFLISILYNCAFIILGLWYIPLYIIKKKFSLGVFLEKLFIATGLKRKESIWFQAVSVGEVLAVKTLLHKIKEKFDYRIVVSTTTITGKKVADNIFGAWAEVIFFPFDITFVLRRAINIINPKLFVAVETEIWPNLFFLLKKRDVPIVILNGRISDKAYFRYKKIKFITKKVLSVCSYIGAQNDYYRKRFISIGAAPDKVHISGNIKFSSFDIKEDELSSFREKYINILKGEQNHLFIAASTHNPEERIVLGIFKELVLSFKINLLIVPRHPERAKEVEKDAASHGFSPVMVSTLGRKHVENSSGNVFILDTVGDLFYFYSLCDVCFVGGSLIDYGGHNILEPIYFRKPTVFGPYMNNFKEIEEVVLENEAAVKVKDRDELKFYIEKILLDDSFRKKLSGSALNVFKRQRQILEDNIEIITKYIS